MKISAPIVDFDFSDIENFKFPKMETFPEVAAGERAFAFFHTAHKTFYGWDGERYVVLGPLDLEVLDTLESTATIKALSANQGRLLYQYIGQGQVRDQRMVGRGVATFDINVTLSNNTVDTAGILTNLCIRRVENTSHTSAANFFVIINKEALFNNAMDAVLLGSMETSSLQGFYLLKGNDTDYGPEDLHDNIRAYGTFLTEHVDIPGVPGTHYCFPIISGDAFLFNGVGTFYWNTISTHVPAQEVEELPEEEQIEITSDTSLTDEMHEKILICNSLNTITITIPTGLKIGFKCGLIRYGSGEVTIQGLTGTTLRSASGFSIGEQYQQAFLQNRESTTDEYIILGNVV